MLNVKSALLSASSAVAIAVLLGLSAPGARAADVGAEVCQPLAGTVHTGYIFGELDVDVFDVTQDYETFFGEGAALYHFCDTNLNVQGDYAFYSHQFDVDAPFEFANDRWHAGGILFWRDQDVGVLGLDTSFINDDFFGKNNETWRIGVRGEYFGGDVFTFGAGAGYLNGEWFGKDLDGFDLNAWGRLYPTENIGLLARVDYNSADIEFGSSDVNFEQLAFTAEGEYLLPNIPMSIFAGARYAERENLGKGFEFTDTQVYLGLSVYFGSDGNGGSLASHHRNNTLDNTNVILEKLPSSFVGRAG